MKIPRRSIAVGFAMSLVTVFTIGWALAGPAEDCGALLGSKGAGQINTADLVPSAGTLPEYCRVTGTLEPAVNYELRLPTTAWNGKLLQVGCGAYCGSIPVGGGNDALTRGYAVTATDSGHTGGSLDGSFGYNNPQAEIDYGFLAVHIVTVAAKHLIQDYYERRADFSYFRGCSTGGRQALRAMEFPDDFDGIIAGDPAQYETGLDVAISWREVINWDTLGQRILTIDKLSTISNAVYAACDGIDGLVDGVIDDPRRCDFDPASLLCTGGNTVNCLSSTQVDVLRDLYDCPRNSAGKCLYPGGEAKGSELGWPGVSIGIGSNFGAGGTLSQEAFRYLDFKKDPGPSYSIFDFNYNTDPKKLKQKARIYNASESPTGFSKGGGKLILYTGWSDPMMSPYGIIHYYEQVARHTGGLTRIQRWFRLFMVPGMYHCSGGPGPNTFDMLTALENWVENSVVPDRIIASHLTKGVVDRTRPLCPYPMVARYTGSGDINEAENFNCVQPDYVVPPNDWDKIIQWPWQ